MSNHKSIAAALLVVCAVALATYATLPESPSQSAQGDADSAAPVRRRGTRGVRARAVEAAPAPPGEQSNEHSAETGDGARSSSPPVASMDIATRLMSSAREHGLAGDVEAAMWDAMAELAIGEEEMLALLDDHCGIESADIPGGSRVLDYAARVAQLGARGVVTESEFYDDDFETRFPIAIEFAVSTDDADAPESPTHEFSPATGTIFATFASAAVDAKQVLVKWIDLDRNAIHVYGKYAIEPRAEHSFVWLKPNHGWPEGTYAVEIYSMAGGLEPIAGGRYVVRPTTRDSAADSTSTVSGPNR